MTEGRLVNILKENYLILLIVLVGLALRLYDIGGESIWFDEAVSIDVSRLGFIEQIKWVDDQSKEGNPPFYYMLLHLWIPVFGDSEFVSRFPSLVFGVLSIVLTYSIGRLLFGKRAGLFAALIIAVSFFHVRYSQEARGYTLMVFLALVSCYALLRLISGWKLRWAGIYVLSSALLCYTHYFGLFTVLAQNIFCFTIFLTRGRAGAPALTRWILVQVILGALYVPGFILLAGRFTSVRESFWIPEPGSEDLYLYIVIYAGSVYMLALLAAFAVLAVANSKRLRGVKGFKGLLTAADESAVVKEITYGEKIYFLLLWLLVPLLTPFLISLTIAPVMVFRYTIIASLGLYLLAAAGMSAVTNRFAACAVTAAVVILSAQPLYSYYSGVEKHQWREVIREIESNAGSGDYVFVFPHFEAVTARYYLERGDLELVPVKDRFPSYPGMLTHDVWLVMQAHPASRLNTKAGLTPEYDFISESRYQRLDLFRLRKKGK
jgi:uncharacterized membrane protein